MAEGDVSCGRVPDLDRELSELVQFHRRGTQDCVHMIGDYVSQQLTVAIASLVSEHDRTVKELHFTIKRLRDELTLVQFVDPTFSPSEDSRAAAAPKGKIKDHHRPESFGLGSPSHGRSAAGGANTVYAGDEPRSDRSINGCDRPSTVSPNHQTHGSRSLLRRSFTQPQLGVGGARQGKSDDSDLDIVYGSNSPKKGTTSMSKKWIGTDAGKGNRAVRSDMELENLTSITSFSSPPCNQTAPTSHPSISSASSPKSNQAPSPTNRCSSHTAPPPVESELPGIPNEPEDGAPLMLSPAQNAWVAYDETPIVQIGDESFGPVLSMNSQDEDQDAPSYQKAHTLDSHGSTTFQYCKRRCWEIDAERRAIMSWKATSGQQTKTFSTVPRTLAEQLISLEQQAIGAAADNCVLHPQSRQRLVWDILAMVFLMYDLIVVPLHVFDLPPSTELQTMDLIILIYWTMDLFASFVTGVYSNGQLILKLRYIAPVYLRRWFAFDCFIIIPEWLVALSPNGQSSAESHVGLARIFRSTRFVRLLRFLRLLRLVKVDKVLRQLKGRINNNALLLCISLIRLTVGVIVLVHCLACAWFAFGKLSANGWIYAEGIADKPLGERYLFSFQFAMARLHPSSYDKNMTLATVPERIFAIVTSLLALAGCGAFVSSVTNTMAQLQAFRQQRTRKLFVIREYVQDYNISVQLSTRVQKYIEKSITRKLREQHANELSAMLPTALLLDLRSEAWTPFMAPQDFFGEFNELYPRTVLCLCKDALNELSVLASETLFYTGDTCSRVLFPTIGKLTYVLGQTMGVKVEELKEHQRDVPIAASVSEAVLWTPWENQGELCAFGDSSLLTLSAKEFIRTVRENERALFYAVERCELVVSKLRTSPDYVTDLLPKEMHDIRSGSKSTTSVRRDSKASVGSRRSGVVPTPMNISLDY